MQFKGGEAFARFKYMLDRKLLEALKKNGIPLLLATDAGSGTMGIVPGFSLHDELRILVENGFTPYEALASGTSVSSKIVQRMNGKDDFGTIEQGKRADLLLLAKNPLDDIANARNVLGVMAAGRWYDQEALAEMLVKKISLEQKINNRHQSCRLKTNGKGSYCSDDGVLLQKNKYIDRMFQSENLKYNIISTF